MELERLCAQCQQTLPISEFGQRYQEKNWMQSYCKKCLFNAKRDFRENRKKRELPDPENLYHGTKLCRGHRVQEPRKNFGTNKVNRDFLDNYCREYRKQQYHKRRQAKAEAKVNAEG